MTLRVAVASEGGERVDAHFGRATRFLIYEEDGDSWRFVETRDNRAACGGLEHDDEMLFHSVRLLSDCKGVAVAMIGMGAIDLLIHHGILPFTFQCSVDDVLEILAHSRFLKRGRRDSDTGVGESPLTGPAQPRTVTSIRRIGTRR